MKVYVNKNSNIGFVILIIEIIVSILCLNGTGLYFGINIHPAIRLLVSIIIGIIMLIIFEASKIGCYLFSTVYSSVWAYIAYHDTGVQTNGDKTWMYVIAGIVFIISMVIHISLRGQSADYTIEEDDKEV